MAKGDIQRWYTYALVVKKQMRKKKPDALRTDVSTA